ncbi:MAG: SpoIID/LytB domain-containing protein [Oscillospiraceae bacterium]|nr:SpoIID/LytB domain-containing protein [Oscillospiraceae bacterium]
MVIKMKKTSLIKISFAMAIISLYTYVYGIMEIVDARLPIDDNIGNRQAVSSEPAADENSEPIELQVTNGRLPRLSDFDKPVIGFVEEESVQVSEATVAITTASTTAATTSPAAGTSAAATTAVTTPSGTSVSGSSEDFETLINNEPLSSGTFRISSGGNTVEGDAFDIVARVVQAEIGSAFHKEAIKAQAVAIYTYIKRQNEAGNAPVLPIAPNASERVREYSRDVWGQAIYHNGQLIQAVYSASSAGWSASSQSVWGSDLPYLRSGKRDFDEQHDPNWGQTVTFSSSEIMSNVLRQTGIQLSGEPAGWLRIINHVDTAYVGEMSIGGKTSFTHNGNDTKITGRVFRERIMGFALRSASFTFEYDSAKDTFTFKTNGYGHGAGMSQNGANILATHRGYDYIDILKYYYTGVEVR